MKATAWLLIFVTMATPTWAVSFSTDSAPTPVGVLRLNELESPDTGFALSRIERGIEKWLDRLPINAAAHPVVAVQSAGELHDELLGLRLNQLWSSFYTELDAHPERAERLLENLDEADVTRFLKKESSGPLRQQAHLARAALEWRLGRTGSAHSLLKAAVYEHPLGLISQLPEWGWDGERADSAALEQELAKIISEVRRPCRLRLSASPAKSQVLVNGFSVASEKTLGFIARGNLQVRAEATGYLPQSHSISCRKLGVRSVEIKLQRAKRPAVTLASVAADNAVKSMLVVTPSGERAKIFLFTPGLRVDEVPTSRPLLLADFKEGAGDALPIATDGFTSLVEAHRVAWLDRRDPLQPPDVFMNRLQTETGSEWYNDWKVWAVVGGIVGGVLVAYFATRRPQVQTNPAGLRISID
ncbi:MAG: hypothetical protein H6617_09960 [Bdellovibrionaceae bacterium]|nr:hypothetical protein [Pseudobdellovibrionaceae bacterium]